MTTFADTYDTNTPLGSDAPSVLDDAHRETKKAVRERENVDHYWPLDGTQVSDADTGEHRKVTIRTLTPTEVAALSATKAYLYRLSTDGELYFKDADNNTLQLTRGGRVNLDLNILANNTAIKADDQAGTGTVDLIKANTSDLAEISDGAVLAAATESGDGDRGISDKAYVETNTKGDVPVTVDSEGQPLTEGHAYRTQTAGFVTAFLLNTNNANLFGYVDNTNDPAGAGQKVAGSQGVDSGDDIMISFFVGFESATGIFFEIVSSETPAITWTPLVVGGGAPIDQD